MNKKSIFVEPKISVVDIEMTEIIAASGYGQGEQPGGIS